MMGGVPTQGKITMDTVLDIIDCFRRGGKLHVHSVQKILKGVYWLFKKFPNIREANVSDPDQNLIVSHPSNHMAMEWGVYVYRQRERTEMGWLAVGEQQQSLPGASRDVTWLDDAVVVWIACGGHTAGLW